MFLIFNSSSVSISQDHGNYNFGYDIKRPSGASNFRKESGDAHGNKVGSYGLVDIDGRQRIVSYVADEHGFRAKIDTNEPGTGNKDAADTIINGADPIDASLTKRLVGAVQPQFNAHPGVGLGAVVPGAAHLG